MRRSTTHFLKFFSMSAIGFVGFCHAGSSVYAQNQVEKSLNIKPNQSGVDYDTPAGDEIKNCRVGSTQKKYGQPGYVVYDGSGRVLRLFFDRNKDRRLDQWSYFKDGVEVYRDSDNDFDGKLDEFRWMGTAGTRQGIDNNNDGKIDAWKMISVEEIAAEVFQAIKNRDAERFNRLLLTKSEFDSMGLKGSVGSEVSRRVQSARKSFLAMSRKQKQITSRSEFVHAGNGQPGVAAANQSNGISQDVVCYDHASAVFKTGTSYGNISLGSVVKVDNRWRLVELPEIVDPKQPIGNGGVFFPMQLFEDGQQGRQLSQEDLALTKLYEAFQAADERLTELSNKPTKANAARIATAQKEKADAAVAIFRNVGKDDKLSWLQTIADTVSNAYLLEQFPSGLRYLGSFEKKLIQEKATAGLDYLRWRVITARYTLEIQKDSESESEALKQFLGDLESFVGKFKSSEFVPEALFQLGFYNEIAGEDSEKDAVSWYTKLAREHKSTTYGRRAVGALARINGVGKKIRFSGKTLRGKQFDLNDRSLRGKLVVIHFWETWCADGMDDLRKVRAKWKDEVVMIGANIEKETDDFVKFMKDNREINWAQLHAPGGVEDSPLAIQVGLISEPQIMVFDTRGRLVNSSVSFSDLDRELQRLSRSKNASK